MNEKRSERVACEEKDQADEEKGIASAETGAAGDAAADAAKDQEGLISEEAPTERSQSNEGQERSEELSAEERTEDEAAQAGEAPSDYLDEQEGFVERVSEAEEAPRRLSWWQRFFRVLRDLFRRADDNVVVAELVAMGEEAGARPEAEDVPVRPATPGRIDGERVVPDAESEVPEVEAGGESPLPGLGQALTMDDVRAVFQEELALTRENTDELLQGALARAEERMGRAVEREVDRVRDDLPRAVQAQLAREQREHEAAALSDLQGFDRAIYDLKLELIRAEVEALREAGPRAFQERDRPLQERMEQIDFFRQRIAKAEQDIGQLEEAAAERAARSEQRLVDLEGHGSLIELRQELERQREAVAELPSLVEEKIVEASRLRGGGPWALGLWPALIALLLVVAVGVAGVMLPRQAGPGGELLVEMANLYLASGENADAVRVLDEAVEEGITDAELLGRVGQTYYALKEFEKAVGVLTQAVDEDSQNSDLRVSLARSYAKTGQPQEAIAQYEPLVQSNPGDWLLHLEVGQQYEAVQDYDRALEQYQRIVEVAPDRPAGYWSQGNLYRSLKDYDEAVAQYQRALAVDPNTAWIRFVLGQTYAELRNWDRAIEQFTAATKLEPEDPSPHLEIGNALRAQGNDEEALFRYQDALDLDPDHVPTLLEMGRTYAELGDCEEAVVRFSRVLEIKPDNEEAQDGLKACQGE